MQYRIEQIGSSLPSQCSKLGVDLLTKYPLRFFLNQDVVQAGVVITGAVEVVSFLAYKIPKNIMISGLE
jgi:hypothetical protein